MITRILIRIKVVQMLYNYFLTKEDKTIEEAKKELTKSFEKAYELYFLLLLLIIELTRQQDLKLDQAKNKYLPTDDDLNPNTRFVDNQFVVALANNTEFKEYIKNNPITWHEDDIFLKLLLDKITRSDIYLDYMAEDTTSFEQDCEFWKTIMKQIILKDPELSDILETKSVYWNDDLNVIETFVLKSMKKFANSEADPILPMFKDDEDRKYAEELFVNAIVDREVNDAIIDQFVQKEKWEVERVAFMDRVILDVAITEIKDFASIPTRVTMNEYIEIAKYYSTPKSGQFINGILNSAIIYLKKEKRIFKD